MFLVSLKLHFSLKLRCLCQEKESRSHFGFWDTFYQDLNRWQQHFLFRRLLVHRLCSLYHACQDFRLRNLLSIGELSFEFSVLEVSLIKGLINSFMRRQTTRRPLNERDACLSKHVHDYSFYCNIK